MSMGRIPFTLAGAALIGTKGGYAGVSVSDPQGSGRHQHLRGQVAPPPGVSARTLQAELQQLLRPDPHAFTENSPERQCLWEVAQQFQPSDNAIWCIETLAYFNNFTDSHPCESFVNDAKNYLLGALMPGTPGWACRLHDDHSEIQGKVDQAKDYKDLTGKTCGEVGQGEPPITDLAVGATVACFPWNNQQYAIMYPSGLPNNGFATDGSCPPDDDPSLILVQLGDSGLVNGTIVGKFKNSGPGAFEFCQNQACDFPGMPFNVSQKEDGTLAFGPKGFGQTVSIPDGMECVIRQITYNDADGSTTVSTTTLTSTTSTTTSVTTTPTSTTITVTNTTLTDTTTATLTTTSSTLTNTTTSNLQVTQNNTSGDIIRELYCPRIKVNGIEKNKIIEICKVAADEFTSSDFQLDNIFSKFERFVDSSNHSTLNSVISWEKNQDGKLTCSGGGPPFEINFEEDTWKNLSTPQKIAFLEKCNSVLDDIGLNEEGMGMRDYLEKTQQFIAQMNAFAQDILDLNDDQIPVFKSFTPVVEAVLGRPLNQFPSELLKSMGFEPDGDGFNWQNQIFDGNTTFQEVVNSSQPEGAQIQSFAGLLSNLLSSKVTSDNADDLLIALNFTKNGNTYQNGEHTVTVDDDGGISVNSGESKQYDNMGSFLQHLVTLFKGDSQNSPQVQSVINLFEPFPNNLPIDQLRGLGFNISADKDGTITLFHNEDPSRVCTWNNESQCFEGPGNFGKNKKFYTPVDLLQILDHKDFAKITAEDIFNYDSAKLDSVTEQLKQTIQIAGLITEKVTYKDGHLAIHFKEDVNGELEDNLEDQIKTTITQELNPGFSVEIVQGTSIPGQDPGTGPLGYDLTEAVPANIIASFQLKYSSDDSSKNRRLTDQGGNLTVRHDKPNVNKAPIWGPISLSLVAGGIAGGIGTCFGCRQKQNNQALQETNQRIQGVLEKSNQQLIASNQQGASHWLSPGKTKKLMAINQPSDPSRGKINVKKEIELLIKNGKVKFTNGTHENLIKGFKEVAKDDYSQNFLDALDDHGILQVVGTDLVLYTKKLTEKLTESECSKLTPELPPTLPANPTIKQFFDSYFDTKVNGVITKMKESTLDPQDQKKAIDELFKEIKNVICESLANGEKAAIQPLFNDFLDKIQQIEDQELLDGTYDFTEKINAFKDLFATVVNKTVDPTNLEAIRNIIPLRLKEDIADDVTEFIRQLIIYLANQTIKGDG